MATKPETSFIQGVHRHLPTVYKEKMNNPTEGEHLMSGTAASWPIFGWSTSAFRESQNKRTYCRISPRISSYGCRSVIPTDAMSLWSLAWCAVVE